MAKRIMLQKTELRELKQQVLARDKFRCRKCGSRSNLAAHHIIFRSDNGDDSSENLATLCTYPCHKAVHGLIKDQFLVISNPISDLLTPNANEGLKFRTYNKVGKRLRWRT